MGEQETVTSKSYANEKGEFVRQTSSFREAVSREAGARFPPELGRYHLYVSYACPWAHRTLIARSLKGLSGIISLSVVDWLLGEKGWKFSTGEETRGCIPDPFGRKYLSEVYYESDKDYNGRFTVPVLYDKKTRTIVNNESSEIIRMFNTEFDDLVDAKFRGITYYPESFAKEIDELNDFIYDMINNGVYKTGFATQQQVYENHCKRLFYALDHVESVLSAHKKKYILGDTFTEVDLRLFTTIIRFDPVYVQHFKCNLGMIRYDYPAIHRWLQNLYWDNDSFKQTTSFDHIKFHYTKSHRKINPYGITPLGPVPNILPK